MHTVTANEIKTRGISVLEERLEAEDEVVISVRGQDKYVVMGLEKYARLREFELEAAIREARADYESGRVTSESVDEHIKRVTG